ncbi:TIGR03915 family putative DNA repair protein [Aminipila luticellarii]|uniref:DNA metabolism protein n=1 Tax=Aminipila luticellarii TaxID=2507160 RepID=A0A410PYG9_9FIRM|nr:TIGR03915 family putative DNA repair protein [Aminipila luticellarii]QAT43925.1 DNA metabolism protein [Aminipila luticellarii]
MVDYLYDSSFEGFLTCVYCHYYEEKASGIFTSDQYQPSILHSFLEINTDVEKAAKVYDAIEKKISSYDLQRIYRVFRSAADQREMLLLNYIRLGFKEGSKISLLHGNPYVSPVEKTEKKVTSEIHRLLGLLRFSVLEGEVLYAVLEPDHDILEFLAGHFTDRYKREPFIIYDKRRSKALVAQEGEWYITAFTEENLPRLSAKEEEYRALWKKYFRTIAIKERTNPRCQKNLMPVRYWKHLTEI